MLIFLMTYRSQPRVPANVCVVDAHITTMYKVRVFNLLISFYVMSLKGHRNKIQIRHAHYQ